MAFFTICATVVLVFTLRSANKTNSAAVKASEAAIEANAIMRAEQRPWVTLDREAECEFGDRDNESGVLCWNYNFVNKGKTPAYSIESHVKIVKSRNHLSAYWGLENFATECAGKGRAGGIAMLFPGESTNFVKYASFTSQAYKTGLNDAEDFSALPVEGNIVEVMFCITYRHGPADNSPIGLEARSFQITRDSLTVGPWRHKMLEYGNKRIIR